MRRAVVELGSHHPVWRLPPDSLEAIKRTFGRDWEVLSLSSLQASNRGDRQNSTMVKASYDGAEVYFGWGIPGTVALHAAGMLRWAHSAAAGVGASITDDFRASDAVLTNSRGIHAEPVSDWVVAAIGFCARGFHRAARAQSERRWDRESFTANEAVPTEFSSLRVGIVGFGGIGRAIARKCAALGMEVRAVRRNISGPKFADLVWLGGADDLLELSANSDVLVLALPHTDATDNLVSESVLRATPRGAFVLNVSRGGILDEEALIEQLDAGHLQGCVLDVVSREPLHREHPFWDHPAVFLTPHVAAVSNRFWDREIDLICDNIGRYLRGDKLRNVVNLEAGY